MQKADGRRRRRRASGNTDVSSSCILHSAFTLLEVMVAMGIFFMAVFSILALVSNGLRNAAALQRDYPDASMLAAMLATTNKLEEGSVEGRFEDIAPGLYPGFKYTEDVFEADTNGLWQVDFFIAREGKNYAEKPDLSVLFWIPVPPTRLGLRR
jgi:Tfp pilus assembly protein PilV